MADTRDSAIDTGGSNKQSDTSTSPEVSLVRRGHATENNSSLLKALVSLDKKRPEESHVLPVYVFTAIFGLIFIIAPLFVRRGPNRSITRVCIMLSTVCCWIFWTTTYIVQMNPLLGPRMSNHSLAWIGHKWGHDPASLTTTEINETVNEAILNETNPAKSEDEKDPGVRRVGNDPDTGVKHGNDPDTSPAVGSSDPDIFIHGNDLGLGP